MSEQTSSGNEALLAQGIEQLPSMPGRATSLIEVGSPVVVILALL